jgi:uncharacterized protein (DUF1778 family)
MAKDKITFRITQGFEGIEEEIEQAASKTKRSRNNWILWVLALAAKKEIIKEE